jgi:hypothetical protein
MYVATCYSLGSGCGDSLKSPARVKKDHAVATANAFKSPKIRSGAFVLPAVYCANRQVQNLDGLRHYTSGKPPLSSAFS